MPAKITITKRTGESTIYRDGKAVGTWPEFGYSFRIHGQMTGIAATAEAAMANALYHRDGTPVPADLAETDRALLNANHNALLARFPFTDAEKAALRAGQRFSDDWIEGRA